ncbi:MAG: ABC transporter permease subunit [Tenericutes bacterium]|nr:ABC transporter permease subunit [Mycoplasmatota bacterium]
MNIIRHEFKSNLKSLIIWFLSLGLLFFVASFEFEIFQNDPDINGIFDSFGGLFDAIGGIPDLTTAVGYLSLVSIYIYVPLCIFSAMLGSGIISKEEKNRTAEYLFTLPVSRTKVIFSKLIVAITNTVLINVLCMGVCWASFGVLSDSPETFRTFLLNLSLGVLLTQLIFLSIGMVLASFLKNYKRSGGIIVGIVIGSFMVSMLVGLADAAKPLKYITPFQYFPAAEMVNGNFDILYVIITIAVIVSSFTGLFIFYRKRDLNI